MSRSRRKNPYRKMFCESSKFDKETANRKLRKACNMVDPEEEEYPLLREVYDTWGWESDGQARYRMDTSRGHKK